MDGVNATGHFGFLGGPTDGALGQSASGNMGTLGSSNYSVYGQHNNSNLGGIGTTSYGIYGQNNNGNLGWIGSTDYGVYGQSGTQIAVYGGHTNGNHGYLGGSNHGVHGGHSSGNTGSLGRSDAGVYGFGAKGQAGYFHGTVQVTGALSKGSGSFKIDHPLDPENKYLYHSFVESPDMMNVYNGNVILDGGGRAMVELPEWFQTVNRDFRYQLTCIGGFAPVYIEEEISGNRFRIAGGGPGMKVSWQVTGIRQDPYANLHRIPVEEDKPPEEQGYYLHPDAYGQPEERCVAWARVPQTIPGNEHQAAVQPARSVERAPIQESRSDDELTISSPPAQKPVENLKVKERRPVKQSTRE